MARPSPRHPVRSRLVLGLIVALLLLWLGEVGLRIAGIGPAYDAGSIAGWRTAASLGTRELKGPRDKHGFKVTTNADGLRTSYTRARTAKARVAIMGDSTVFGWGVDDGGTVADGLEASLTARGYDVEVLNAGQPGYSTVQAAWLFRESVAAYKPDLVITFLPLHDHNLVLVSDAETLRGGVGAAAAARVLMAQHSRIYAVLRGWLFRESARAFILPNMADGEPRVPRVSDEERAEALSSIASIQAVDGHQLGVGLLPFLGDLTGAVANRVGVDWLKTWAEAENRPFFDARRCCGSAAGHLVLPDDPGHLTQEGNFAAAESLADAVVAALASDPG